MATRGNREIVTSTCPSTEIEYLSLPHIASADLERTQFGINLIWFAMIHAVMVDYPSSTFKMLSWVSSIVRVLTLARYMYNWVVK